MHGVIRGVNGAWRVRLLPSELRQTLRRFAHAPAYAALTIGILAVGMGTNAAMLALVDALLFRPPAHVIAPEHVVRLQFREEGELAPSGRTHYPAFLDLRKGGAFETVAAYADASVSVGAGRDAVLANALLVSQDFFQVLRPQPFLGTFATAGEVADAGEWVVVSHGFWERYFGAQPNTVGAKITIDGEVRTIVAIAPSRFANLSTRRIDLWLPLNHLPVGTSIPSKWRENRERLWLNVVGRLPEDGSRRVAEQRATATLRHASLAAKDRDALAAAVTASLVDGREAEAPIETRVSFWLAGLSAILLLIACSNVSNLVLTRVIAQRRELLVRRALGAFAGYFTLRALLETLVIVAPAALGALVVSSLLRSGIVEFVPRDVPLSTSLWDERTASFVIATVAFAMAIVFGTSIWGMRAAIGKNESILSTHAAFSRIRIRRGLLATQAGLSLVLLFVAGVFTLSLRRAESLDLGAELDRTIQLTINLAPVHRAPGVPAALYQQALERLAQHPGVERVALSAGSPFMSGSGIGPRTSDRSFQELWAQRSEVAYRSVIGAGFFSTVGATVRGRDLTEADTATAQPVAIINAPLARYLWPSSEAIGQCMWLDLEPACVKVVGVLNGVWKFNALDRERMAVYLPLAQVPGAVPSALFVRPKGDARLFLPEALAAVQNIRPDLPAARGVLLRTVVENDFRPWRLGTTVFSAFAGVALLLTAIGLYGVVAASVELRQKEIAIRVALGARGADVMRTVVGEGLLSVSGGLAAGIFLVLVASRWLRPILFQTSPNDPLALMATVAVLLSVAAAAATVPATTALRITPSNALRVE